MVIHKAKTSSYNDVTTEAIYDHMRKYLAEIADMIEPVEDGTGNDYKAKQEAIQRVDRATLKACAAELETVVKRLNYGLYGKY